MPAKPAGPRIVTTIRKPAPETVSQLDLAEIIVLRQRAEQCELELAAKEADVRARLQRGAAVEPGLLRVRIQTYLEVGG